MDWFDFATAGKRCPILVERKTAALEVADCNGKYIYQATGNEIFSQLSAITEELLQGISTLRLGAVSETLII